MTETETSAATAHGADTADPRRWRVLAIASVAQYLAILDLFAVNVAFPAVQETFGNAPLSSVSWVLNAYTIVVAAFLVPAGRLADDTGRKRCFLIGMALFGVASIGCAVAPSLGFLIAARVAQAVAAAILIPTSLGIALPLFDKREHPRVMGIWTAVAACGAGTGPVLGGALLAADWRWIFAINIPITIAAFAVGARILPATPARDRRPLDLVGAVLVLLSAATSTGLIVESSDWGLTSSRTIGMAAVAVLLGAITARHLWTHPDPVISPQLFGHRLFSIAVATVFLYYLVFASMLLAATLFFTMHWHYSLVAAGVAIAPIPLSCLALSPFSARIVGRIGGRWSAVAGGLMLAVGCVWWASWMPAVSVYSLAFLPGAILTGASTALLQPPMFGSAGTLPTSQISLGSAVLMMARQLSSALGIAVLTVVLSASAFSTGGFVAGWIAMAVAGAASGALALRYVATEPTPFRS